MEEKIVALLQDERVDEAIQLYADKFGVTLSEAKGVIETFQSELTLFAPNHRSDSAFTMQEVNMMNMQVDIGDVEITVEYLQNKYGISEDEARFVLDGIGNGMLTLPSYESNVAEIIELLKHGRKITAITRYKELYDVELLDAKMAVQKIERLLL
ncbi:MAG: hypothetical protein AB8G11_21185 [Saprospiraceae bacterium]